VEIRQPTPTSRHLALDQSKYDGGIQIWGSNPALVWTSDVPEEEGIHVHAFKTLGGEPEIDDTVAEVTIDGITLDAVMVRTLMAQSVLPHVSGRLRAIDCPECGDTQFDTGKLAFTPRGDRLCGRCGHRIVVGGRVRRVIANPLPIALKRLAAEAPRTPQPYGIDLLPDTPRSG
jgi:DNA-directed RNA polymerase subunit RPC12/RpoP